MRLRTPLIALSLLANAGLLAALAWRPSLAPPAFRDVFRFGRAEPAPAATVAPARAPEAKTAAPKKLWPLLEADDPATLIQRLRAAGFPAALIREIIRAQIAARYDSRMRAIVEPDPGAPFWKQPANALSSGTPRFEEYNALLRERTKLQRDLFADPFFDSDEATAAQRQQYGNLPRQKLEALQRIEEDYAEMTGAIRRAAQGILLKEDREKLAFLEKEKRADLALVLDAKELADYQMRTSPITRMMGSEMGDFRPTEAEFRALFAMNQALNEKFPPGPGGTMGGGNFAERAAAQREATERLRAEIGDARVADYFRETSSDYQQLKRLVQRENLPADAALRAYGVRDTVAQESLRIFDDPALSSDDKRTALATLAQNTRNQVIAVLGPVAGPDYVKTLDQQWLNIVARGAAVTFDGASTRTISSESVWIGLGRGPSFRSLPPGPR